LAFFIFSLYLSKLATTSLPFVTSVGINSAEITRPNMYVCFYSRNKVARTIVLV
jgi:hypothetical protein